MACDGNYLKKIHKVVLHNFSSTFCIMCNILLCLHIKNNKKSRSNKKFVQDSTVY